MTGVNQVQVGWRLARAQTTTEYAMIVAAVIVVLVTLYNTAGALVNAIINGVIPLFG
ncbi:MAG: hypothetical protein ACREQB_03665 [Candidatus Binataceae bacterium]